MPFERDGQPYTSRVQAEGHDAHQHGAASARQPGALTFDATGKVAAASLLEVESVEDGEESH